MQTEDLNIIKLAAMFSELIRINTSKEELEQINEKNNSPEYKERGSCATHEYFDANDLMLEAFEAVFSRVPIVEPDSDDMKIMSNAWTTAKQSMFTLKYDEAL